MKPTNLERMLSLLAKPEPKRPQEKHEVSVEEQAFNAAVTKARETRIDQVLELYGMTFRIEYTRGAVRGGFCVAHLTRDGRETKVRLLEAKHILQELGEKSEQQISGTV